MADYFAKSTSFLSFDLTGDQGLIGNLSYKNWFTLAASVTMPDGSVLEVEPKGFWGTTIEVNQGAGKLLSMEINWQGDIVINTHFTDEKTTYLFKHRGLFNESFTLTDRSGLELVVMKPDLKWSKLNYDYQITTSETLGSDFLKALLLMTCLHCANYYMFMIASAVA